jgi:hypothetical protein
MKNTGNAARNVLGRLLTFFTMDEADFWLLYVPVVLWLIWV